MPGEDSELFGVREKLKAIYGFNCGKNRLIVYYLWLNNVSLDQAKEIGIQIKKWVEYSCRVALRVTNREVKVYGEVKLEKIPIDQLPSSARRIAEIFANEKFNSLREIHDALAMDTMIIVDEFSSEEKYEPLYEDENYYVRGKPVIDDKIRFIVEAYRKVGVEKPSQQGLLGKQEINKHNHNNSKLNGEKRVYIK